MKSTTHQRATITRELVSLVYDPVAKVIGATTVVQDLSVVGVDLVAQANSVIVERTRGGETTTLSASIGFNALPGDVLSFSLPAQNRGVLTAPSTFMEIETPMASSFEMHYRPLHPTPRSALRWHGPFRPTWRLASLDDLHR